MTTEELIKKSEDFLKRNKNILWRPLYFPEDMEKEDTVDVLESQGNDMYDKLCEANSLIMSLTRELEIALCACKK